MSSPISSSSSKRLARTIFFAACAWVSAETSAQAADFHEIFENRCLRCHGHAGAFARDTLVLAGEELRTSVGMPVAGFLSHHAGGLTVDEVDLFVAVFVRQLAADGLFEERCRICHLRARDLARRDLVLRGSSLFGRYTGREIGKFLTSHGRLTKSEAVQMTDALAEILRGRR